MIQTHYLTKRANRRMSRAEYPSTIRNDIILCTWATDPANVGSITRLSEAYLVGAVHALKRPASHTAVGTGKWQPVTVSPDFAATMHTARMGGYTIVALEQTDESISLHTAALPERMCLLIGNEGSGLPQSALDAADIAIEIPQYGMVGSLNVATATAIALYEWSRQHRDRAISIWA